MLDTITELDVQGQTVQKLYTDYQNDKFVINRRYQRKLVWDIPEKQKLIDSIISGLPIPLILLAESQSDNYEIIDGLQRMNAIFSFINNDFSFNNKYFDLDTLADTKFAKDNGMIEQKLPIMGRADCLNIANYQIPISKYRSASESSIDEVFRRINSSGKKLSLQEIRQAGDTSDLSQLIRRISSDIRGDVYISSRLPMKDMPSISLSNGDLEYGVDLENIFWVSQGVLDKESVRESRDEEFILDLLLDIIVDPVTQTGSSYRDSAFGRGREYAVVSPDTIAKRINTLGVEEIYSRFMNTFDKLKELSLFMDGKISTWIVSLTNPRGIPRYFQSTFIPLYNLLYKENLILKDVEGLAKSLKGVWNTTIKIPSGGGKFTAEKKKELYPLVEAKMRPYFITPDDPEYNQTQTNITQFEKYLTLSMMEDRYFELKQGFTDFSKPEKFNDRVFNKILKTSAAMSNSMVDDDIEAKIFFGVADKKEDAEKISEIHSIAPYEHKGFWIVGTSHELEKMGKSEDDLLRLLSQKTLGSSLPNEYAKKLANTIVPFKYRDLLIWSISPFKFNEPVSFDNKFYERVGNSTVEVSGQDLIPFISRFK